MKELAEKLSELIKGQVGVQAYLKAYQTIRKNAEASRLRKKKQRMADVILDPEKAILQKRRKNERTRDSRRRKTLERNPARDRGLSAPLE